MKMIKSILIVGMMLLSFSAWSGHVDINQADAKTLAMELKGIGLKKAQAIVDYRAANGAFKVIEDLSKVKGISDKTIEKNRKSILLGKK